MKINALLCLVLLLLIGCQPEMPVTSVINIEADGVETPVNPMLYGLTLEEINRSIEGGLYGELIRNRSFEDGVIPLHCAYDRSRDVIVTPNGWSVPFIRPDSIPGWHALNENSYLWIDPKESPGDLNNRSLLLTVNSGGGGAVAEGFGGIGIRKGEQYNLSLYLKSVRAVSRTLVVALRDSTGKTALSDLLLLTPMADWRRVRHTFTATADAENAVLTITSDTTATAVWLDRVSLFPAKTYNGRTNGLRPDLATLIADLHPQFIRFPGGSFVEGYNIGTFPTFKETTGNVWERRHFWNVWGYGTTSGMGYHEYLQFCEDLKAEPVYVVNAGITSQSRRPRYEDITKMDELIEDALQAISYANDPVDSIQGAQRARNGHVEPFHLKYIEVGSQNYGYEYNRRFYLFKEAINAVYPEVTVISSAPTLQTIRTDWVDRHYVSTEEFFLSASQRYNSDNYPRRAPAIFIGAFGSVHSPASGTLGAAIAEAAFLTGIEQFPASIKGIAYAPLMANVNFPPVENTPIRFNTSRAVLSPSYHLFKLFARNRGHILVKSETATYLKPLVSAGRAAVELFDNSYDLTDVKLNGASVTDGTVVSGGWKIRDGELVPDANRWNNVLLGKDTTEYNYTFSARIRRTKGSDPIQLRVRDNGRPEKQRNYIGLNIGVNQSELFFQAGLVKDTLITPVELPLESQRWYTVKLECQNEVIRYYLDDRLIQEAKLPPIPSLASVVTRDTLNRQLIIKVVNTTLHEERTALNIHGASVKNEATILQMTGEPESRNTFEKPDLIVPEEKRISFPMQRPIVYVFPPQSITIIKLDLNE